VDRVWVEPATSRLRVRYSTTRPLHPPYSVSNGNIVILIFCLHFIKVLGTSILYLWLIKDKKTETHEHLKIHFKKLQWIIISEGRRYVECSLVHCQDRHKPRSHGNNFGPFLALMNVRISRRHDVSCLDDRRERFTAQISGYTDAKMHSYWTSECGWLIWQEISRFSWHVARSNVVNKTSAAVVVSVRRSESITVLALITRHLRPIKRARQSWSPSKYLEPHLELFPDIANLY